MYIFYDEGIKTEGCFYKIHDVGMGGYPENLHNVDQIIFDFICPSKYNKEVNIIHHSCCNIEGFSDKNSFESLTQKDYQELKKLNPRSN